jgi:hypothetical protein
MNYWDTNQNRSMNLEDEFYRQALDQRRPLLLPICSA